jgi:hypothetical protein
MDDEQQRDPHHPDEEPAAAEPSPVATPGASAPADPAPDLDRIESGDGPGQTPGE